VCSCEVGTWRVRVVQTKFMPQRVNGSFQWILKTWNLRFLRPQLCLLIKRNFRFVKVAVKALGCSETCPYLEEDSYRVTCRKAWIVSNSAVRTSDFTFRHLFTRLHGVIFQKRAVWKLRNVPPLPICWSVFQSRGTLLLTDSFSIALHFFSEWVWDFCIWVNCST